ncbi:MAG: T9SS type A sorting domain-containing protein [Prolixibacteraceae bacterium]|jgi:hypothetical protein|nr:T9SS type A sorting domain-containing protein [Prolixibacteraceae bacterium]MBT7395055.1 T9SS type A sorting domain-containing protein [Prolixibacteraceae bacterium]
MKLKLLLFLFLFSTGIINAQDTIRSLVITEARSDGQPENFIELTNMGDQPVDLSQFEFGLMRPWANPVLDVWNDPWTPEGNRFFMLPEVILQPGESWVITTAYDFGRAQYLKKVPGFEGNERQKQAEMYELGDYFVHVAEPKGDETDSVTVDDIYGDAYQWTFEEWSGRGSFYIEQHLSETDSVVIDQVNGVFDNDGLNFSAGFYDVAGVTGATGNSTLVRKFGVKTGNLDFANARGVGLDDSEWMPVPNGVSPWRDVYWSVGNHGAYNLDENTLESDVIDVDFTNKVLTVPWGIRRGDGIMHNMVRKPGIAWQYHVSAVFEDSLSFACHTGDQIEIYVFGEDLDVAIFDIVVADPTADANIVVPVSNLDPVGGEQWWRDDNEEGLLDWPRVTQNDSGIDTITGTWFGIPFATRSDTLIERLEKAVNANWEFVWVDGVARPDLKNGDKLKVTAQNGAVKEYCIQVQPFDPSHNAYLSSITWPDIPDFYRGIFGWVGDTVPGFNGTTYNYKVTVPLDVEGIPALVTKTEDLNAKVDVSRAASLSGSTADRTVSFVVTAEDDSVKNNYSVELIKEKDPSKLQPYAAEPFLSELVFWDQWSNSFGEICNPGNQPLDLSNYMIAMDWNTDPAAMVGSRMGENDWLDRYDKYVPGYKWVDQAQWAVTPGILRQDLNVNPIVMPGDVFCFGGIATDGQVVFSWGPDYVWPVPAQLDVQFHNTNGNFVYTNPWGEEVSGNGTPIRKWFNANWYMFKILNDSIKLGLKPANDPNDFELIEVFGMADGSNWVIGGKGANMITNWFRKPDVYMGNPEFEGSFGTNPEDSEWGFTDQPYWQARNAGWPYEILNVGNDIGQHFMYEPTHYKSTVSSIVYKVSEGFSMNEEIRGMVDGTTVANFLDNLIKANENQTLLVKSGADDSELPMDAILSMDDILEVMSADSSNTTLYVLEVSENGLSGNAVLTSARYEVTIDVQPKSAGNENDGAGSIEGFEYGTQLKTVVANVVVPAGAIMNVISNDGAYVAQKQLNFDTAYVDVTVNHNMFFEVTAENGVTRIVYQLKPEVSENSAFLTSDVYTVVQKDLLVTFVPRGTSVSSFLANVVPSLGASIKVVDKSGLERTIGELYQDDKVIVTSPSGTVQTVYFLSMLRTEFIPQTTYLAYILSNTYAVDQVNNVIGGASGSTTLAAFYSSITTSMGATAVVVDANGNEKTTGDLDDGDMVKVTSADGKMEAMYTLNLDLTSADVFDSGQINLYPNPTSGRINISGVEVGGRIQVFNLMGVSIQDINIQNSVETVMLNDQPAGMYLIVVSDEDKMLGRYKVLRR